MYYVLIEYAIIIIIIIIIIIVVSKSIMKESFKLLVWRHEQTGKLYGYPHRHAIMSVQLPHAITVYIITVIVVVIFYIHFMLPNRLWNNVSDY